MGFTPIISHKLDVNIDEKLLAKAEQVCIKSAKITVNDHIKELLRMANSYYSNKIALEGIHPINIDKAAEEIVNAANVLYEGKK